MQNKTSRQGAWTYFGRAMVGRRLATLLGATAIGAALFSVKSAAADPIVTGSQLPNGDFMMSATYCPGSVAFSECTGYPVDGGFWLFNSDGSMTQVSNGGEPRPGHGAWDEVAPGQVSVEFFNEYGFWLFSVLANQTGGGDYPCFEGLLDDLDIGVLSVRLCLEP